MILYKINLSWNIFYIIPVLLILFLFVFGFCTFFLHFGVFVEDLTNVVTICLKLVFYISGIMYNIETRIKGTTGVLMSKYNPMAFLIVSMRKSVLYNIAPSWRWMLAWTVLSLALIYIGVSLIYKNENSYVKAI
jgi:teichoic acid transport system permease protein